MHRQTKYNRKNKELISRKAKERYDLERSTKEGEAKAKQYAKDKQARYRQRKLLKDAEQLKLRLLKFKPDLEKWSKDKLFMYLKDWEHRIFNGRNRYWTYDDADVDFALSLKEVKMIKILLQQMIDKRNKFTGIYEIRKGEKVGDVIHIEKDYYGMPIYGYEGLYSILRNSNIYVHPRKDKDGKTVKGWGRKKIIEVKDFLDVETEITLLDENFVSATYKWINVWGESRNLPMDKVMLGINRKIKKRKKSQVTEIKQDEIKEEVKSYPDPTVADKHLSSFVKGFDNLDKFYRVYRHNENYWAYTKYMIAQERRVDSNGNRIVGFKKIKPLYDFAHKRYVSLQDANFKTVRIKWSDIIKNYEDENGEYDYNHYKSNIDSVTDHPTMSESEVEHKLNVLKTNYNPDGTSKIIEGVELLIAEQEKQFGRKLSINEEMRIESDYQFENMKWD